MTNNQLRLMNLVGPCPDCGNGRMTAAVDVEGTINFLCRECGACLHAELEWVGRVDPRSCAGCDARGVCSGDTAG
jgi:hypothetical protein